MINVEVMRRKLAVPIGCDNAAGVPNRFVVFIGYFKACQLDGQFSNFLGIVHI